MPSHNRGLVKGFGPSSGWQRYQPNILVSGNGTPPSFGTPAVFSTNPGINGQYVVVDGLVMAYVSMIFGSGGSPGSGSGVYQIQLPPGLPARAGSTAQVGDYNIGSAYVIGATGQSAAGAGYGLCYVALDNAGQSGYGQYFQINLLGISATVTATINSGSTSATVTHGWGAAPSVVIPVPNSDPNALGGYWISSITSSQFTINCHTAPGSNFSFKCYSPQGTVSFGPTLPWASFGQSLDHCDIFLVYPLAS